MVAVAINAIAAINKFLNQSHPRSDSGVVKNNGIIDRCTFADVATWANHSGPNYGGSVLNFCHATNVDRTINIDLVPVRGHIKSRKDARAYLDSRHLNLTHITLQNTADSLPVIGYLADVNPLKFHG